VLFTTPIVQPSAGDVPVAHSAATACELKKGAPNKASRLLYLRMVFFNYFPLSDFIKYKQSKHKKVI
jgi:hypothetical protein